MSNFAFDMKRTAWIGVWTLLHVHLLCAQTVSTILPGGSGIDEALFRAANGVLYGTGYDNGTLNTFAPGAAVPVLDALDSPSEMAELSDGRIAVAESQGHRIVLFDPVDETQTLLTSMIPNPAGLVRMPGSDSLLVSSVFTNSLYCLAPNGDTSLYLSSPLFNAPVSMLWDDANNLYTANYYSGRIVRKAPDDSVYTFCTLPTSSLGHIARFGSYIYATGVFTHQIYRIDINTAEWTVYAGSTQGAVDGGLDTALFNSPNGISISATGDSLYISEYNTKAIRLISGILPPVGLNEAGHSLPPDEPRVWPNPVRTTFFLHHAAGPEPLQVQLFDTKGALVFADLPADPVGEGLLQVHLPSRCAEGLYLLQYANTTSVKTIQVYIGGE